MKQQIFTYCTIVLLMFSACQDNFEEDFSRAESISVSKQSSAKVDDFEQILTFEQSLHLTASAISKALLDRVDARTELQVILSLSNNSVTLERLIGDLADENSALKNQVLNILDSFLDPSKPEHGVIIPPAPGGGNYSASQNYLAEFLIYILEDNCVEIYFPNGLDYSSIGIKNFTASSHPMNDRDFNGGVKYTNTSFGTQSTLVTVDSSYVSNNSNLIIARPYRSLTCQYAQFTEINDFRTFLQTTLID